MRGATEYHTAQPLTDWPGDVASLVAEMKRRSGVRTDQELARFIGSAQSTVSNWRKRGAVPEAAILQFERAVADPKGERHARSLAARSVALRIAEYWYSKSGVPSRSIPYSVVAYGFNGIVAEVARHIEKFEGESGHSAREIASALMDDAHFLDGLVDWIKGSSAADLMAREVEAARRAVRP